MVEVWREIPDTDYSVSSEGRVASRYRGGRVLKPGRSRGYMQVRLCDGRGGQRDVKVHRLVAGAFLGPPPTPLHQINHKNGVKSDNRVENLEWVTQSGNQRHRHDVLKHGALRGEQQGNSKLTEVEAREIIWRGEAGECHRVIAADYGISRPAVSRIVSGKAWRHLS